jgi:hypothetical protein
MLNWKGIGSSALWVIGVSLCLAALSYADWWAHCRRVSRRQAWNTAMFLMPFSAGLSLVCAGLSLKAHRPAERAFWAVWTLLLIVGGLFLSRPADGGTDD